MLPFKYNINYIYMSSNFFKKVAIGYELIITKVLLKSVIRMYFNNSKKANDYTYLQKKTVRTRGRKGLLVLWLGVH